MRFSSKIGFSFASADSADAFSAAASFKYSGWGVSVAAAASYASSKERSSAEATLTATRDFLPIGFQVRLAKCNQQPATCNVHGMHVGWQECRAYLLLQVHDIGSAVAASSCFCGDCYQQLLTTRVAEQPE